MNKFNCNINPITTYCSKECYEKYAKKFIWEYEYKAVKRQFKSAFKQLENFSYSIYKWYLKDIITSILGISIILMGYLILNSIIWAVEKYVN